MTQEHTISRERWLQERPARIANAVAALGTVQSKELFQHLAEKYPGTSVFWGQGTAILSGEGFSLEVTSDEL